MAKFRTTGRDATFSRRINSTGTIDQGLTPYCTGIERTVSTGHDFFRIGRRSTGLRDIGGPFESTKVEISGFQGPETVTQMRGDGVKYQYENVILLPSVDVATPMQKWDDYTTESNFNGGFTTYGEPGLSHPQLHAYGAKAISQFSPLNPIADTSTTIAEFLSERQFFSIPGQAGSLPGEYLNYMFGIAPTVSYAKDLRDAMVNKERYLEQLSRDSGRVIRRRGIVSDETSTESSAVSGKFVQAIGYTPNSAVMPSGTLITTTTTSRKVWFSGAFTYYLPREGTRLRSVAELDKLYGVKVNVDTAWELLPFSWLVDYKSSAGSVLANLSAFGADGLIMPYGYIMATTKVETQYELRARYVPFEFGPSYPRTVFARMVKTTKQRVPASPFGFGILPDDLTTRQKSILVALGLTWLK